jgi:XTP/dITP diphosphohydrolase
MSDNNHKDHIPGKIMAGPDIFLGTANPKKIVEYALLFKNIGARLFDAGRSTLALFKLESLPPPEEDGKTFYQNAYIKARYYADHTGIAAFSDDSGLMVKALGGDPGVRSHRYGIPEPEDPSSSSSSHEDNFKYYTDEYRNEYLLKQMEGIKDRRAVMAVSCVLAKPHQSLCLRWDGTLFGLITEKPIGNRGFGYDPVFFVPKKGKTLAEMTLDEKETVSHRGKVIDQVWKDSKKILEFLGYPPDAIVR